MAAIDFLTTMSWGSYLALIGITIAAYLLLVFSFAAWKNESKVWFVWAGLGIFSVLTVVAVSVMQIVAIGRVFNDGGPQGLSQWVLLIIYILSIFNSGAVINKRSKN